MPITDVTAEQLKTMLAETPDLQVIDVRTGEEYEHLGHIPNATLIPVHELPYAWRMVDDKKPAVVVCQHGVRSMDACYFLQAQGYTQLYNLSMGMSIWDGDVVFGASASSGAS